MPAAELWHNWKRLATCKPPQHRVPSRERRILVEPLENRSLLATLEETFLPDDAGPQDLAQFGYRVAASSTRISVSAPLETLRASPIIGSPARLGEVLLMDLQGNIVQRFVPNDGNPTSFQGSALALDENYLFFGNDRNGIEDGYARVVNASTGAAVTLYQSPNIEETDRFGHSVALSGSLRAIGAPSATYNGTAGAVHVFHQVSGLVRTIKNPDSATGDAFGTAIAMVGNILLVGTPNDDNGAVDAGRAYLFDVTTGALLRTFDNPSPEAGDLFGGSVALQGNLAIISAASDNTSAADAGQVYVFDVTTGQLLRTLNAPAAAAGDQFGTSIAILNESIVIGAPGSDIVGSMNEGRTFIVSASTGSLIATIDNPSADANDSFGSAVAISSAGVVVGAPLDDTRSNDTGLAHLFDSATGALTQTLANPTYAANDRLGAAVAIAGDYYIVGMPGDDTYFRNSGKVRIYSVATRALLRELFAPTPAVNENFGSALATFGGQLAVGAPGEAASDGSAVYIYDLATGSHIRTLADPSAAGGDLFGAQLDWDGNKLIVGSPGNNTQASDNGVAYAFDATTGNLLRTLSNPSAAAGDKFGSAVAISGNRIAVGAPYNDTTFVDAGSAYLFDSESGNLVQAIANPFAATGDLFGSALDLQGDRLVIGAPEDDVGFSNAGGAYAFHGGTGAYLGNFNAQLSGDQSRLGSAISLSGNRVLVGSNSSGGTGRNYVHLYTVGSLSVIEAFQLPAGNTAAGQMDVYLAGTLLGVGATEVDTINSQQGASYLYSRTTMTASLTTGNLTIGTSNSTDNVDNNLRIVRQGADLIITDSDEIFPAAPAGGTLENGGRTIRLPWSSITGTMTVNLGAGADFLTVDLTGGDVIPPGGLTTSGGTQTNTLSIVGGEQGDVVYTQSSATVGTAQMPGFGTLNYSSFSVLQNSGNTTSTTVNLRPGTTTLGDDGVSGNGLSQLTNGSMVTMQFASPSGPLAIIPNGNANTINFNALPDFTGSLLLGSDADRLNILNFSGSNAFATDRSLTAFTTGTITQNTGASLSLRGTGSLSLTSSRAINVLGGGFSTVAGDLSLMANQQATSSGGSGASIYIHSGTIVEATGAGNVTLLGRGRTSASDGNIGVYLYGNGTRLSATTGRLTVVGQGNGSNLSANNHGVLVEAGAMIRGGAGGVTVDGTGGTTSTTTGGNHGVFVRDSGSQISSSSNGNVLVRGTGGLAATSFSAGVYAFGLATISAGGTGTVTVEGRGSTLGTATASGQRGVVIDSGTITSSGGAISVNGWGGGTGSGSGGNHGVYVRNSNDAGPGRILSTANATITVNGTGGNAGAQSGSNYGVFLTEAGSGIFGTNGAVSISGVGGGSAASSGNTGLLISNEAKVAATGNFAELKADSLQLASVVSVQLPASATLYLRTNTAGLPIHLGGADVPATALGISSAELNSITGPSITIGDAVIGGDILLTGPVSRTVTGNILLAAGVDHDIVLGTNSLQVPAGNLVELLTTGGQITMADQSSSAISASLRLSVSSEFRIRLAGPTMFDALAVTGQVQLAGNLNLTPLNGYLPFTPGKFVIVQNDGNDPIGGKFSAGDASSLPVGTVLNEGAVISNNLFGTGMAAAISYLGGDGNDVELTLAPARETPTARIVDNRLLVTGTTRDDIILASKINNQIRVRVGSRVLGLFDNLTGISIDTKTGDDFVYVAPFMPATIVTRETDPIVASRDLFFAGDNTDVAPVNDPAPGEDQSVRDAILIQLLIEWTEEYDQLYPGGSQNPTVRRR